MSTDLEDDEVIDATSRQLRAANQLPPELMLIKMENESIMSVARATPRDPKKIVKQLAELIDAYPEAADEAIYVKPVGTEMLVTCGSCKHEYPVPYIPKDGVQCPKCSVEERGNVRARKVKKFAEGLSIRAAESIRSIYGYNRLAVSMKELADGKVELSGVFVDYATGTMTSDTRIVSPFYTDRFKKQAKHPEDRFLNVLVKAEKSKLRRDIIMDSVPNSIKAAYRDCCEKKLTTLVSPDKIKNEILPWFAQKGLTAEHLEKIIGRPLSMGWTEQDRSKLKQIATALKNEETTVAELLADLDDVPQSTNGSGSAPSGANGGVNSSDLTSPQSGKTEPSKEVASGEGQQTSPAGAQTQTKQTEPEKTKDDAGTKTVPDKATRFASYAAEFEKVKKRTEIIDTKSRLKAGTTDADDHFEIDRLADVTKDRIEKESKTPKQ